MPENMNSTDAGRYNDELARFADRTIGGERPEVTAVEGKDQELAELMVTVASLERTLKADRPDPAMSGRIRANLLKEWEMSGPATEQGSFWRRLWPGRLGWSSTQQRQLTGLIVAIGVVALLLVAYPLLISGNLAGSIPGSGGGLGQSVPWTLIVGGLVILMGAIWWLNRPRR
jgi:hypothetical protein